MGEDFKTNQSLGKWGDRLCALLFVMVMLGAGAALNRWTGPGAGVLERVGKLETNASTVNSVMDQNAKEINGFAQMVNNRLLTAEQKLGIPPPPPPAPAPAPAPPAKPEAPKK